MKLIILVVVLFLSNLSLASGFLLASPFNKNKEVCIEQNPEGNWVLKYQNAENIVITTPATIHTNDYFNIIFSIDEYPNYRYTAKVLAVYDGFHNFNQPQYHNSFYNSHLNRVRAGFSPALPTPPYMRVRIRRFTEDGET